MSHGYQKNSFAEKVREEVLTWPNNEFTIQEIVDSLRKEYPDINVHYIGSVIRRMVKDRQITKLGRREFRREEEKEETQKQTEMGSPEEEQINWGDALFAYVGSLKEKIQKLSCQISDEQQKQRDLELRYHRIIKEKDSSIAELKDKITLLNRRVIELNKDNSKRTFSMAEVARFGKGES